MGIGRERCKECSRNLNLLCIGCLRDDLFNVKLKYMEFWKNSNIN